MPQAERPEPDERSARMYKWGRLVAIALVAVAGCGHETDESTFTESFCDEGFADCDAGGECEFFQECVERRCHEEEGYEDDGDFYYKSRCTEEVTFTEIFYPEDGGAGLERITTDTSDCRYREEEDFWDDDFDEEFSCDEFSEVDERSVDCEPVVCSTCEPSCR
jgi:hypothetical protein